MPDRPSIDSDMTPARTAVKTLQRGFWQCRSRCVHEGRPLQEDKEQEPHDCDKQIREQRSEKLHVAALTPWLRHPPT